MLPEVYQFIVMLAGAIIALLLAIIGYFLNKHVSVTETLTKAVNALNITVELLQNNQANFTSNCRTKHQIIDVRLNQHSEKIAGNSESLAALKMTTVPKPRKRATE